jgi:hypothetical protein
MNMTTTGLASPPRAAPPRVHKPAPRPPEAPRKLERSPPAFGKILGWSLGASLLVHLLFLLLSPLFIGFHLPAGGAISASPDSPQAFGLEMVIPIPSENAPENPPVEEREEEPPPVTRPVTPQFRAPVTPSGGGAQTPPSETQPPPGSGASVSEALRPGYRDSRLYVEPDRFPELRKTQHERYMEHLQARIDAVNDSMGVAAARERRTSDWVYTDDEGRSWGLSPDGLHLGGITVPRALLPLPGATGDNQSLEAERERLRQREEIQNQEARRERDETTQERLDAMREDQDSRRDNGGQE